MHQGAMDDEESTAKHFVRELRDVQKLLAEGSISETEAKARSLRMLGFFPSEEVGKPRFCLFPLPCAWLTSLT